MKKQLNKKEIQEYNQKIKREFGIEEFFNKKEKVESEKGEEEFILQNGTPMFFFKEHKMHPTLKLLLNKQILKTITVDMGAVKFITNGADVMRPGITKIEEEIKEGDAVCIIEETHGKALAVGIAMFNAEEMKEKKEGKVVKTIHYVGDIIWKH